MQILGGDATRTGDCKRMIGVAITCFSGFLNVDYDRIDELF
jgi:hypothetical protein